MGVEGLYIKRKVQISALIPEVKSELPKVRKQNSLGAPISNSNVSPVLQNPKIAVQNSQTWAYLATCEHTAALGTKLYIDSNI